MLLRRAVAVLLATLTWAVFAPRADAAAPGVVSTGAGQLDVFARSPTDGSLLTAHWDASGWGSWTSLGGVLAPQSDIAAISRGGGEIEVFVRGTDNGLYQKVYTPADGWSTYYALGGTMSGGPTATSWGSDRVDVFVRANNTAGNLLQKTWSASTGWQADWTDLGGATLANTGPGANSRAAGYVDVAVTGTNGNLYVKSYRPDTGWFPFYEVPGRTLSSTPGVASVPGQGWAGRQDYVAQSAGSIWQDSYLGPDFSGWNNNIGGQTQPGVGAAPIWWKDSVGAPPRMDVFTYALDGSLAHRTWLPSAGWVGWSAGPGPYNLSPPFLAGGQQCGATDKGWATGSVLGVSISRNVVQVRDDPKVRQAFDNVVACFRRVNGGRSVGVRIQMSIDAMSPDGNGYVDGIAQARAFADLLAAAGGGPGVVSIMPPTFGTCDGQPGTPMAPTRVGTTTGKMAACQYPTPAAYRARFKAIRDQIASATGNANIYYSAWNEPDHSLFTLYWAASKNTSAAAQLAGQYYAQANSVLKAAGLPDRTYVLAGEFAGRNQARVDAFKNGAATTPTRWAYHPYGDVEGDAFANTVGMQSLVPGAELWLTELGTRNQASVDPEISWGYGNTIRTRLASVSTKLFWYHVSSRQANAQDSGLVDSAGQARPVLCGIGGLPSSACLGSVAHGG